MGNRARPFGEADLIDGADCTMIVVLIVTVREARVLRMTVREARVLRVFAFAAPFGHGHQEGWP
jgi:hypothetical protein